MSYKPLAFVIAVAALAAAGVASASPPSSSSILIRHQVHGCHTWSVNGGPFRATQTLVLRRGGFMSIANYDVMPHTLVLLKGPALTFAPAKLGHMGAAVKVTFAKPGVYRFATKAGEDYPGMNMSMMKTIGEDNVLRLTVTVR